MVVFEAFGLTVLENYRGRGATLPRVSTTGVPRRH